MINCVSKEMCVGCKACGDVCPKKAIDFEIDREGFWFPKIDESKCVDCGKCNAVCPSIKGSEVWEGNSKTPDVYAVYSRDESVRYNSTSGGLYYELAKSILDEGGYLIGCAFDKDYRSAVHIAVNDEDGLRQVMRSKYFQSDTEGIYCIAKSLLDEGKKVLFSGTPCQVAALYKFLNKNYEKLYTVDFVCLGVNSPLAYKVFIEELCQKYNSSINEVHFKNKSHGWLNLGTRITFENGKVYYKNRYNDPWINAYIVGKLYIRHACSSCKFKTFPRVSDISFGDFWGIDYSQRDARLGVSLALINNDKGYELIDKCKERISIEQRDLSEAINGNPALVKSVVLGKGRKEFFDRLDKKKYSDAVWETLGKKWPVWWIEYKKNSIIGAVNSIKRKVKWKFKG